MTLKNCILICVCITSAVVSKAQCDLQKSSENKPGYTRYSVQHQFEMLERLAGRNNNGEVSVGYLHTHIAVGTLYEANQTDTVLNFWLMITSKGTGIYYDVAMAREIIINFTNGTNTTIRASKSNTEQDGNTVFYFIISAPEIYPYLVLYGINSIFVNDYKSGKTRTIYPTYKNMIKDQLKCIEDDAK